MLREIALTVVRGGINRQRTKGGAPSESLYDLLNGYITAAGTVVARPGTDREDILDAATRGLVYFNGSRHVFSHDIVAVPDGYTLNVLHHPDSAEGYVIELEKIHFAVPIMGALYVAAEFEDGRVFHYWLQEVDGWSPSTQYLHGAMVFPTIPNGIAYQASRLGDPYPAWAPGVPRSDGLNPSYEQSIIEPTEYNDFFYTCELTGGLNPRSGEIEPEWPTEDGAQVIEYADGGDATLTPEPPTPPSTDTPQDRLRERYGDRR